MDLDAFFPTLSSFVRVTENTPAIQLTNNGQSFHHATQESVGSQHLTPPYTPILMRLDSQGETVEDVSPSSDPVDVAKGEISDSSEKWFPPMSYPSMHDISSVGTMMTSHRPAWQGPVHPWSNQLRNIGPGDFVSPQFYCQQSRRNIHIPKPQNRRYPCPQQRPQQQYMPTDKWQNVRMGEFSYPGVRPNTPCWRQPYPFQEAWRSFVTGTRLCFQKNGYDNQFQWQKFAQHSPTTRTRPHCKWSQKNSPKGCDPSPVNDLHQGKKRSHSNFSKGTPGNQKAEMKDSTLKQNDTDMEGIITGCRESLSFLHISTTEDKNLSNNSTSDTDIPSNKLVDMTMDTIEIPVEKPCRPTNSSARKPSGKDKMTKPHGRRCVGRTTARKKHNKMPSSSDTGACSNLATEQQIVADLFGDLSCFDTPTCSSQGDSGKDSSERTEASQASGLNSTDSDSGIKAEGSEDSVGAQEDTNYSFHHFATINVAMTCQSTSTAQEYTPLILTPKISGVARVAEGSAASSKKKMRPSLKKRRRLRQQRCDSPPGERGEAVDTYSRQRHIEKKLKISHCDPNQYSTPTHGAILGKTTFTNGREYSFEIGFQSDTDDGSEAEAAKSPEQSKSLQNHRLALYVQAADLTSDSETNDSDFYDEVSSESWDEEDGVDATTPDWLQDISPFTVQITCFQSKDTAEKDNSHNAESDFQNMDTADNSESEFQNMDTADMEPAEESLEEAELRQRVNEANLKWAQAYNHNDDYDDVDNSEPVAKKKVLVE